MMRLARLPRPSVLTPLVVALWLCAAVAPAFAQQQPAQAQPTTPPQTGSRQELVVPPETNQEVEQGEFRLDIGIGLKGGLNGAWMLEVPENADYAFNEESKSYYSAFGLGGDIGLMLDARALGIVGIETGLRFSSDNAQGFNELKDGRTDVILYKINQEQRTTSMRIPLLLKLSTANGVVRPTFAFGLEFVRQLDTSLTYDIDQGSMKEPESQTERREARNQIEATQYKLLSAAFGIEIDLGPVKIPIELRAQYNLDYGGESFENRVRVEGSGGEAIYYYNGGYQGHFGITIGLIYDLGLFL